ncbi:unnamed protein product [Linum tenue]|uniref:Kinesin motor domain-containing protein n=1 Tax=Linum tenue TaxID=586396 RepID=A0AAV0LLI3_9ROSI|nr:unnamed protein product [Linum tenue]
MDSITSPPPCLNTVSVRRNPPRRGRATPMKAPVPIQLEEFQSTTIPDPPTYPVASQAPPSESLKVFLRIKPVVLATAASASKLLVKATRSRAKNAWPQNPTAKKNSAKEQQPAKKSESQICISVINSRSVTISPPPSLIDSKTIKSEVYERFSHVFAPDFLQVSILRVRLSHSAILILWSSGSGKTHTVFGTPREPGIVPLALEHIFKQSKAMGHKFSRSFHLSIFEIYSERGKGEKKCDMIPERVESGLHSTTKGVQEARFTVHAVVVSNASEAESLIACAMLKRATVMANTNSQSRPQILVVILQGAKLLESSFINNTSMVFGLCLKSITGAPEESQETVTEAFSELFVPEASIMDKSDSESFTRERNDIIVQNFAKELKQYKEKLLVNSFRYSEINCSL